MNIILKINDKINELAKKLPMIVRAVGLLLCLEMYRVITVYFPNLLFGYKVMFAMLIAPFLLLAWYWVYTLLFIKKKSGK
jgi:hypothetical protein